jgi:hypothetical protein
MVHLGVWELTEVIGVAPPTLVSQEVYASTKQMV